MIYNKKCTHISDFILKLLIGKIIPGINDRIEYNKKHYIKIYVMIIFIFIIIIVVEYNFKLKHTIV